MSKISLNDWLGALADAMAESVISILGCEQKNADSNDSLIQSNSETSAAFISMVNDGDAVELGLVAKKPTIEALAKIMLGMAPTDDISKADVADAVGEIMNVVAGGVKKRLNEMNGAINLGLPLFVDGAVVDRDNQESVNSMHYLGEHLVKLKVIRGKS